MVWLQNKQHIALEINHMPFKNSPYKNIITGVVVIALVIAAVFGIKIFINDTGIGADLFAPNIPTTVTYGCASSLSIKAGFKEELAKLILSDGREYTLSQVVSSSGMRYTNDDESIVFWEEGDTAFFEESGTITFRDCVKFSS